ncbi:MarC family protein [Trichloromonas sp.]|uniref:MarC family protein n=1 Tax=Trichloromonas sp. TaxID=3069249 RepID=UPI003D816344
MEAAFDVFTAFALQLFIIVDPIAGVPVFLAITPDNTPQERRAMAIRGCLVAFAVLVFFLLFGRMVMNYFGIETPAVRICGGLLLFVISLEMLYGRPTGTGTSRREERLAEVKEDISITPLAFPLLAGPGAIATCLIFAEHARTAASLLALLGGSAAVFFVSCLFLLRADTLLRLLGTLGTAIVTRLMGLVLAFLSVQYVIDGIRSAFRL